MRKRFTLFLASLLLCMGTAWSQPEVGKEYRIRDDRSSMYLTIQSYNGSSDKGTHGTVPLLEKSLVNEDQVWVLETADAESGTYYLKSKSNYYLKCRDWNVDALNGSDKSAVSLETPTVDYLNGLTLDGYVEGSSFCIKNGEKYFKSESVSGTWHPFCNATTTDGWANRTTWTFEEVSADEFKAKVTLTVTYKYGERIIVTETVEEYPGTDYTFVSSYAFTSIASCVVNETETEGAAITVPDADAEVTVNLADNLPFTVSESYETATWYVLNIRGSQNVVNNGTSISSNAAWTASDGALWAFMGNPFDGIQVLNKAAGTGKTLGLGSGAQMLDGTTTWNILKNGNGFILRVDDTDNNCLNDVNGTLSNWDHTDATTDAGSTFIVKAEATVVSEAATALTSMNTTISSTESTEATYFVYSDAAAAAAKAKVEGVATPTDFMTALQAQAKVAEAQTALGSKSGAPVAGDYVRFKNRQYPVYLATTDDADNVIRKSDDATDLKALWLVEAGDDGSVLLKNVGTEKYMGSISKSTDVLQVEAGNAAQFTFSGIGDVYGRFKVTSGDGFSFANMNVWGTYQLQGWEANEGNYGSHWVMTQAYPLTVVYNYNGEELTELAVDTYADAGSTYTIANPYANKYVSAEISVNGTPIEDGVWSVEVTANTEITVTYTDALPFKVSTNYDVVWHYMQMNSNGWKYVKSNHGNNTTSTTNTAQLDDASLWAFVGDALNGFKILNKAVGGDSVLYVASTNDGTAAYMNDEEEMKWTIEKGNGGFVIRQGTTECLNDYGGGGVMKIWNAAASPNGAGSAFQAIEYGLRDLSELANPMSIGIYTLQAERSPLLYSTTEGMTTKLSSGLVNGVAADEKDVNQHFLFLRTANVPEGYFYLYSVGAKKFVDAELNLTDFPEPVLSFEAYTGTNSALYPWWVKIADKYVIPGNNGTAGNKIFHVAGGDDDDGKRYRIVKVGTYTDYSVLTAIEQAEDMIKQVSELSNEKVYTVSTYDRGYWYYNTAAVDLALWSTTKADMADVSSSDANVQFAFLTVAEHTYLYSIGAQKFVIKKDGYTTYSDEPTQAIELLDAQGTKFYPFVAAFVNGEERHHIGISNGYTPPVITSYNDLNDGGNKIKLREVTEGYMAAGAAALLAEAVAKIEDYLVAQELKPELLALIDEAQALLNKDYLDTEDTEALTNAKTTAQGVCDNGAATAEQLTAQVELLTEAITAVTYVREVADFKNAYVYTFVSNRSATAYMMYDGETDYVASQYMKMGLAVGAEEENCQWAVYTSTRGYYYLYNLGAEKFMGTESAADTSIPFSATPQTTELTFKVSAVNTHPIMISTDGGAGAANHSNNAFDGKNQAGLINWVGGFGYTSDGGNVHQVAIVGALAEGTLATIAEAVKLYEDAKERTEAIQALETAIAAAQAKVDAASDALGYYSSSIANVGTELETIVKFKEDITESTTVPEIEEQTAAAEAITASFSLNLPEAGKFYRIKNNSETGYLSSGTGTGRTQFVDGIGESASSVFYYTGTKLLDYTTGLYLANTGNFLCYTNTIGDAAGTTIAFSASPVEGKLLIAFNNGNRSFYSAGTGQSDAASPNQNGESYRFTVEEVTILPVTVSAVGYSTFYTPVAVTIPGTVTAYVISETLSNSVALEEVTGVVPAGTGLILEGEGDHTFVIATEGIPAEFDKGLLKGSTAKTLVTPEDGYTCYVLANGSEGVGLYKAALNRGADGSKVTEGGVSFLNNACKVYLPVGTSAQEEAPAMFGFRRGATEIENSEFTIQKTELVYDLTGRRILEIVEKGIYIVNGKKVVIK